MHGAANQKGEGEDLTPRTFLTQTAYSFFVQQHGIWIKSEMHQGMKKTKTKQRFQI